MKTDITVFIFIFYSCSQPTNSDQNEEGLTTGTSVFNPLEIQDLEKLTHPKQELVDPPFLPEHEQSVSDVPVVVEVTMTIEKKLLEIAPS